MTSMRPIGAAFARASAMAAVLFVLASGNAAAVVRDAGSAATIDRTIAPTHRGAETLHALRLDRRAFEASAASGRALDLPGTNGAPMHARFARSVRDGDITTWIGKVDTDLGEQSVVITFGRDATFGTIPQRKGAPLRVEAHSGQSWLIEGEPRGRMRSGAADDVAIPVLRKDASRLGAAVVQPQPVHPANTAPVIDLLVVYTPSLVARLGSTDAVMARISYLVAITNQAFYDSPAMARVRAVSARELNYTAATDNLTLLNLVTSPSSDPVKSQIDAWREQAQADLVVVLRAFDSASQPNCGQAWIGGYHGTSYDAAKGFAVVGDGHSGGFYCEDKSFAHEIGHNLGGHHDYVTANGDYGYDVSSRGYRQTLSPTSGYATIMAYADGPQVSLMRFSNAKLAACLSNLCGNPDSANMVWTIDWNAWRVASYRGDYQFGDSLIQVAATSPGILEGNSGSKQLWFRIFMDNTSPNPVFFDVSTEDGQYTQAGVDYVAVPPTHLSIPAGGTYIDFPVTILGDTAAEMDESFYFWVRNVSGAMDFVHSATGTIRNDDLPQLSIADASVTEGNSGTRVMNFTVLLSAAVSAPVTFDIATITPAGTTATPNVDFVPVAAHLQIPVGTRAKAFAVTVKGDAIEEPNETFIASITNVVGANVTDGAARGTILNDEPPRLSIDDVITYEGNSGWKQMVFTVRASQPVTTPVYFNLGLAGGNVDASDIMANSSFGAIPAGQQARTYTVSVQGDTVPEVDEYFIVSVSSVQNAILADGAARGTIVNDDDPVMTIGDITVAEGNSGNPIATFTVQLNGPAAAPVTFDIATFDTPGATARPGTDYVAKSQLARTIPMGGTSAVFNVGLIGDTVVEPDEVFVVTLSNVTGAILGDGAAKATIINDD
jgi:hypothetical protein